MSESKISILYVDDEPLLLDLAKKYLERTGDFIVDTASSAKEGLKRIYDQGFDAVVSDYQMPEMDGLTFLRTLRSTGDNIPFIIFTGKGREEVAIEALNAGADYYLHKGGKPGVQFGELQNFIRQAVKKNRAEKTILEHERRMADIINFLPDATFAIDKNGRVITWNKAIEKLTGSPASEMIGKGDYQYAVPFYGKPRPILIDLVLHQDLQKEVSYDVLNFDNKDRLYAEIFLPHFHGGKGAYFWFTASPLYDTDGNVSGAIESIRDITEYKQTEGLYKTIFENTGTAMMIVEDNIRISNTNEKMKQLWGFSKDNKDELEYLHRRIADEDIDKMLEYHRLRRTNNSLAPDNYECKIIHKDGSIRTTSLNAAIIPGTNKSIISLIDITEQKEAERLLRFTKFCVDNAPEGILWADNNGRIFLANKSAIDMYGYPEEELIGMYIPDFAPDFPHSRFKEFWEKARDEETLTFEAEVIKKDGTTTISELYISFLNFEGQDYECGFARDITSRKKSENTLKALNKKLQILSTITRHDISNQISVIMGYEELLESEIEEEKARRYLNKIFEAAKRIEAQIKFTRAYQEIGLSSPTWQSVDLVVHSAAGNIPDSVIKVMPDIERVEIYADQLLQTVLYNIFENAVRHGGNITEIKVSFHEKDGKGILVIEDNGKGVSGDLKGKIFERGVGSNTGMGLFLAKEILDMTDISISETGEEGKGTRFEILVPSSGFRFKS